MRRGFIQEAAVQVGPILDGSGCVKKVLALELANSKNDDSMTERVTTLLSGSFGPMVVESGCVASRRSVSAW